jgi:hypothetical protein
MSVAWNRLVTNWVWATPGWMDDGMEEKAFG